MQNPPPHFFLRFFRWYCHPKLRDHIEGDLIEIYNERLRAFGKAKADSRFIIDVLLLFRPGIIRPARGYKNINTFGMYKSYLIVAARNLVKQKAHNIFNVLGLSMGIAAGLIIAIHIRGELSYETSFPDYENIFRVHREGWATSSPPLASEFRDFFKETEDIARFSAYGTRVVSTEDNNPGEATGYYADSSVLNVFGFKIIEGDPHPLGAPNTVVITQQMARRYFGNASGVGKSLKFDSDAAAERQMVKLNFASRSAIGKTIKFDNGREMAVTAVMADLPSNSHLNFDFLVSMPTFYADAQQADRLRGWMTMYTYARLRPGSFNDVSARMPEFIRKYYTGDPEVEQKVQSGAWRLIPLKDIHLRSNLEKEMHPNSSIVYVYVFIAVELLILIIASANFMSLFTTQALRRVREVGMRKVMGAKTAHLIGQFLMEVLLLIFFATALALVFYQLALPFYNELTGKRIVPLEVFQPGNVVTIGIMLVAVILLSGLYPAIFIAGFKPGSFLRENRLPNSMPNLLRKGLLVFQFVVSMSLIAAAIIVRQQMDHMRDKDLGFDKEQVVNVKLYGDLWQRANEADVFKNEFLKSPDVLAVGRVDRIIGERLSVENVVPKGKNQEQDHIPDVRVLRVDEGYLEAMKIRLLEGRNFSLAFNDSTSFIINQSAAKALGLTSPVNEILESHSNSRTGKIVGVVEDYHFATLHGGIEPLVIEYKPQWTSQLVIRIQAGKTREAMEHVRATVDKLAPNSLFIYNFLDDRIDGLYKSEDTMGKVFQFFSLLAVIIACMGLFGLASYTIERRTKEIGIRKVLGASVAGIVSLVSSSVFRLITIGFIIAVAPTWYFMDKWLNNFAYKIEIEWWVFALTGMIILVIASLAIGFRTINAARANPVHSLRNE